MSLDVNISEPDEFKCNELHSCIEEIAKLNNLKDFSYHVDFVCGRGENYIANIFRVLVTECENTENIFCVIVKTLINTTRQELFHDLHTREVMAYEKIIKKYNEIQNKIDSEEQIILPRCLYTRTDNGNEVIILEDMKIKGFDTDNKLAKFEHLDYTQVNAVIRNIAKFHALSFIYEKHEPESFGEVKSEFKDIIFSNDFLNKSKLKTYFEDSFGTSLELVDNIEIKNKLERVQLKLLDTLQQYTKPGARNVLCHGDFWINNVMFKNEDSKIKICLIDFQTMRYSNPATDVVHFLYICTDSAFRSAYLNDLINDYYDSLKLFLNLYDIEVNSVYTREDFDIDVKETLPYGLLMALIELKLVTTTPEDNAILRGSDIIPYADNTKVPGEDKYFKIRVNDVVTESLNNGVLDKLLDKLNC